MKRHKKHHTNTASAKASRRPHQDGWIFQNEQESYYYYTVTPARIDAETMQGLLDATNTNDEELDPSVDLNTSAESDTKHQTVKSGLYSYPEVIGMHWKYFAASPL